MLHARVAIGACAAAALAGAALLIGGGSSPAQSPDPPCADLDTTFTTDSLHDLRSFADAFAVVRGVREAVPPTPDGPEGWAGLIGRYVTVRVERVLWRRPNAPEPPRRFRFSDLGWTGTLEQRQPFLGCGDTRMVVGRRYLAPVVRDHGGWYPFSSTLLRLRGKLVVGGVDAGEADHAHQALVGRSVRGAVRTVAETLPYRSTVLHPGGSPGRRWQRAQVDNYRLWDDPKGVPVIVASGVTSRARWQLYLRLPARGGMCVGMTVRALWHPKQAASGEGCGPRTIRPLRTGLALFGSDRHGLFAYGHTGSRVYSVRVRFGGEDWKEVQTTFTPIPPGGRDRFWVVPADGDCTNVTVQAIGPKGNVVDEKSPRPYAAC
jgi:hypothetical protein